MTLKSTTLILILLMIFVAAGASVFFLLPFLGGGTVAKVSHFTIVMSTNGFNGSASHSDQWPVIRVAKGQAVRIHVVNQDPVEPHGLAIDHYFVGGTAVTPGKTYDITFNANESGSFRVYCNIFCAIHPLMQNGVLIVT
jgi:nitrous oxide reductase